jgi:threonine/homoserine/homoserine lactone efflux protein
VNYGMDWATLIGGGLVIGLLVAAPIGPVNLICIRRTLTYGQLNGFMAGMGAACGDGIFAIISGFGVTWVFQWIEDMGIFLKLIGATILMIYGIRAFIAAAPQVLRHPDESMHRGEAGALAVAVASTFALTITNPATLVGFAASFAGLQSIVDFHTSLLATFIVVVSVFGGSALWWFVVTEITAIFHKTISPETLRHMNQGSGILIFLTGLTFLGYAIWQRF